MKKTCFSFPAFFLCLLSLGQTPMEKLFDKGVNLLNQQQYAEAIPLFSGVIVRATDKKMKKLAYIYRAYSFQGLMEVLAAIKDLDTAWLLDPLDYGTLIDRGRAKGIIEDYVGADKDLHTVLGNTKRPEWRLKAYYWLALSAYHQHRFPQAIEDYTSCIALDSTNAEFYFNRAIAKGMLVPPDLGGSIQDYDQAIRIKSDYSAAYANRGVAKINQFTTSGTVHPSLEQTADACRDLQMARMMGDSTVVDMIFVYCGKK